jgi:hypothetical protein
VAGELRTCWNQKYDLEDVAATYARHRATDVEKARWVAAVADALAPHDKNKQMDNFEEILDQMWPEWRQEDVSKMAVAWAHFVVKKPSSLIK